MRLTALMSFVMALLATACAPIAQVHLRKDDPESRITMDIWRSHHDAQPSITVPSGEVLYVAEKTSPMLTDQAVELLKKYNFNAVNAYKVPQPLPASRHQLSFAVNFFSTGKVHADLSMDALFDHREDTIKGNQTIGNFLSLAMHFVMRAALPSPGLGGLNLIADAGAVAKVTGIEGAVNERMYGDYRGRCTLDCDTHNVSNQRVTVIATYENVVNGNVTWLNSSVMTKVSTDTLIAYELIDKSLLEALLPFTDPARYRQELVEHSQQVAGGSALSPTK